MLYLAKTTLFINLQEELDQLRTSRYSTCKENISEIKIIVKQATKSQKEFVKLVITN